jgi:enhancing lycopene biosynthesis protein 2
MVKVGVLLSGCGYRDGSEVFEAVLTILALEKGGAQVQAIAPDGPQAEVIDHYTGEEARSVPGGEGRNALAESARIVRGRVVSTREVSSHELDALVIVGGWGVVKNLCTYVSDNIHATLNSDVERLIKEMNGLGKPIGAMSTGAILVSLALQGQNISVTTGGDPEIAARVQAVGATHAPAGVDEIHIDEANHLVTTPAFILAKTPGQAEPAINALVARVLSMAEALRVGMPAGGAGNTVPGITPHVH